MAETIRQCPTPLILRDNDTAVPGAIEFEGERDTAASDAVEIEKENDTAVSDAVEFEGKRYGSARRHRIRRGKETTGSDAVEFEGKTERLRPTSSSLRERRDGSVRRRRI